MALCVKRATASPRNLAESLGDSCGVGTGNRLATRIHTAEDVAKYQDLKNVCLLYSMVSRHTRPTQMESMREGRIADGLFVHEIGRVETRRGN
jgi:hypothetical protein